MPNRVHHLLDLDRGVERGMRKDLGYGFETSEGKLWNRMNLNVKVLVGKHSVEVVPNLVGGVELVVPIVDPDHMDLIESER